MTPKLIIKVMFLPALIFNTKLVFLFKYNEEFQIKIKNASYISYQCLFVVLDTRI